MSRRKVRDLLMRASQQTFAVIGDVMLDRYIWGNASRISPEAPVPVVEYDHEDHLPGGAANVARNLSTLGTSVKLFGIAGEDAGAELLNQSLKNCGISTRHVLSDSNRKTSVKTRILAGRQQMLRVDEESRTRIAPGLEQRLLRRIKSVLPAIDAVIFADYGKGVVSDNLLKKLVPLCRKRGLWTSLDPHPLNSIEPSIVSLMTPNRSEAFSLAGRIDPNPVGRCDIDATLECAKVISDRYSPALLLITLGPEGLLLCSQRDKPVHIPTAAREVYDVSGAGDTVVATFTLAIAAGASPEESAILANHAAGVVVGKLGTASLTAEELLATF